MQLERDELSALIPHAGSMCLLDGVLDWDDASIRCISNSHRNPANPLRHAGRLSALCAFEYGAQAAAVHGALCLGQQALPAYLAALKNGHCQVPYLDTIAAPLQIDACLQYRGGADHIYQIRVSAEAQTVAEVRISVMAIRPTDSVVSKNSTGKGTEL